MDWTTFFSLVLAAGFAYATFSDNNKKEVEIVAEPKGREAELFCKTQYHHESEPYLFQCNKCGQDTDLRIPVARGIDDDRPGTTR